MKAKKFLASLSVLTLTLLGGVGLVLLFLGIFSASGVAAGDIDSTPSHVDGVGNRGAFNTVITVTSGTDPDDSKSRTCYTDPAGPPGPPTSPCTLRRAIVEANALDASARPILIRFEIPEDPNEGFDGVLGVWKIHLYSTLDTVVLGRLKDGQITIDGSTQPGGRADGPKIILVGPGTGSKDGLVVGDVAGDDGNVIRGMAFQNLKTHLIVNTDHNMIEENWFGLSDDGLDVFLRRDDPEDGSGNAGVALQDGADDNLIQMNVFAGLDGVAAAVRSERNTFTNNRVGTTFDGGVPGKQTDPDLVCTQVDWLGGGGISVDGRDHIISDNVFAGLRQEIFQASTQPDAIRLSGGEGHLVQNNQIGVDAADSEVGVCGRGVYLISSPEAVMVISNTIIEPGLSAISLNGVLYDANTLRSNAIKKSSAWPEVEGNPEPEDAIQLGPVLPEAFRDFNPAQVTEINGLSVSGTSGVGSDCPNCIIELFLDDDDSIVEALQSLAVVSADANGDWEATLPFELTEGEGIRTTSTTAKFNTINNMSAGTTTGLSDLYVMTTEVRVFLPLIKK